jgi:putative flavoprotein involved in K+ transport
MTTQHIETLIIGAGQAGLSTGYHLKRLDRECLIVDGLDRIGDNWRRHYDSLRLFTPSRANSLDGMPFPGDPWAFPTKDEFAAYLELYAVEHDLPVRMRTRVDRLTAREDGG